MNAFIGGILGFQYKEGKRVQLLKSFFPRVWIDKGLKDESSH